MLFTVNITRFAIISTTLVAIFTIRLLLKVLLQHDTIQYKKEMKVNLYKQEYL